MKISIGTNKKKLLAIILSILVIIIVALIFSRLPSTNETKKDLVITKALDIGPPPFSPEIEKIIIAPGRTITEILTPHGFSPTRIIEIRESIKSVYDLARIPAGKELRLFKTNSHCYQLQMDLDSEHYLEINLQDLKPKAEIKSYPINRQLVLIEGTIKDSLISAINEAGEQDLLALMLAEIFGWNIDFYLDLRQGDIFRVLVEKKFINGEFSGYGPILAAWFVNKNKIFEAYRFQYPETGKADYFDSSGGSLRKEFLKSPLRYVRITSRFSFSRLHPIRKIYRPHYGIDYAAPIGTPVQATAAGIITFAGWNGAAGRMVKIRHKNDYESMYLHLKSLATGIRVGAKVGGGEVIGYVGSSGESTGPHLDYRLLYHGKYVNPLSWKFQPAEPLAKEYLPEYARQVINLKTLMYFPVNLYFSR
ncbi:MAG: peptidoglycan DD-metalloendopeptidase family protein [Candidatus Saccharicenans sp.]